MKSASSPYAKGDIPPAIGGRIAAQRAKENKISGYIDTIFNQARPFLRIADADIEMIKSVKEFHTAFFNTHSSEDYKPRIDREFEAIRTRGQCSPPKGVKEMPQMPNVNMSELGKIAATKGVQSAGIHEAISCALGSAMTAETFFPKDEDVFGGKGDDNDVLAAKFSQVHTYIQDLVALAAGKGGTVSSSKIGNSTKSASSSAFVVKIPLSVGETTYELIHEAFVGFFALNKLRDIIPNFTYTYAAFICSPPINVMKNKPIGVWCTPMSTHGPRTFYIVSENVESDGRKAELAWKAAHEGRFSGDIGTSRFLSIVAQITCALKEAYRQFDFTHYDLHAANVMLAQPPAGAESITIEYPDSITVIGMDLVKIIDYGRSHVKIDGKHYGALGNYYGYSIYPDRSHPTRDLAVFITTTLIEFSDKKQALRLAQLLLHPFFSTSTLSSYDSFAAMHDKTNGFLPWMNVDFSFDMYIDVIKDAVTALRVISPFVSSKTAMMASEFLARPPTRSDKVEFTKAIKDASSGGGSSELIDDFKVFTDAFRNKRGSNLSELKKRLDVRSAATNAASQVSSSISNLEQNYHDAMQYKQVNAANPLDISRDDIVSATATALYSILEIFIESSAIYETSLILNIDVETLAPGLGEALTNIKIMTQNIIKITLSAARDAADVAYFLQTNRLGKKSKKYIEYIYSMIAKMRLYAIKLLVLPSSFSERKQRYDNDDEEGGGEDIKTLQKIYKDYITEVKLAIAMAKKNKKSPKVKKVWDKRAKVAKANAVKTKKKIQQKQEKF